MMQVIALIQAMLISSSMGIVDTGYNPAPDLEDIFAYKLHVLLLEDATDKRTYQLGEYVCLDYAIDLKRNLSLAGYNAFIVLDSSGEHAWNMVADGGLREYKWYFIEPQTDEFIPVELIGEVMIAKNIWRHYYTPDGSAITHDDYMDLVWKGTPLEYVQVY